MFLFFSSLFSADEQFYGRWDIKVLGTPPTRSWWLEVTRDRDGSPKGRFVGSGTGALDDTPDLAIHDGELSFSFERSARTFYNILPRDAPHNVTLGNEPHLVRGLYRARVVDGRLKGTFTIAGQTSPLAEFIGVRAPTLPDKDDGSWHEGQPISVFNSKDLSGWVPLIPGRNGGWMVKDGVLTNMAHSYDLVSKRTFTNFKLHAEYRVGPDSNSGIKLRGRYEVQVLGDYGKPPSKLGNGALYSRIVPSVNASKPAGEWQTFDIRLVGRQVTIVLNGTTIIDKGEIEGLTASWTPVGTNPYEVGPGPIVLQGDHGVVEFRRIVVTPLVR
jgi:hypothetical protein